MSKLSQSIFLMENQLKTLQSVTRNGRISYKGDHIGYIDIYADKHNIIHLYPMGLKIVPKRHFRVNNEIVTAYYSYHSNNMAAILDMY